MTIYKKGTCETGVVVSSSVYVCNSCDHTEIVRGDRTAGSKKCPQCQASMSLVSSHASDE